MKLHIARCALVVAILACGDSRQPQPTRQTAAHDSARGVTSNAPGDTAPRVSGDSLTPATKPNTGEEALFGKSPTIIFPATAGERFTNWSVYRDTPGEWLALYSRGAQAEVRRIIVGLDSMRCLGDSGKAHSGRVMRFPGDTVPKLLFRNVPGLVPRSVTAGRILDKPGSTMRDTVRAVFVGDTMRLYLGDDGEVALFRLRYRGIVTQLGSSGQESNDEKFALYWVGDLDGDRMPDVVLGAGTSTVSGEPNGLRLFLSSHAEAAGDTAQRERYNAESADFHRSRECEPPRPRG